jgi:hypothetical protein
MPELDYVSPARYEQERHETSGSSISNLSAGVIKPRLDEHRGE